MYSIDEANGCLSFNSSRSSPPPPEQDGANLDVSSLSKLSSHLENLLLDSEFDCTDAEIVVDGVKVGVHRCILSARSLFFRGLFSKGSSKLSSAEKGEKPRYNISELLPHGKVGHDAFMIFLSYVYTGMVKQFPREASICCDNSCVHDACWPAVNFVVELLYAFSVFEVADLIPNLQRRLLGYVDRALVEDVIPIILASFHCKLDQLRTHCVTRIARSDLEIISIEKELPYELSKEITSLRAKLKSDDSSADLVDTMHEKRIRRIHRALDSDDLELLNLLLTESKVTLDDAYALHYAVAYCDSKIVAEVLGLGIANTNLKNCRGYTPLHVAAMRREPAIILSLLNRGASVGEMTGDGRCAVSICRRMTRAKEYHAKTKQCQEVNKDKLCIDVLEREMRRNPLGENESATSSPFTVDDLLMKLMYLENRVACARALFPTEAKVAMKIAHADEIFKFEGLASFQYLKKVDLNETPIVHHKRLRSRMVSLQKTVDTGRRYFPNCSQVIDNLLENDIYRDLCLDDGTLDEQKLKRLKLCEMEQEVNEASSRDQVDFPQSVLSSSSSC